MNAGELKKKVKKAKKEDLCEALMLLYKNLSETQKENLESALLTILEGKKGQTINFPLLEAQVDRFITNVKKEYYYKANQTISKDQRTRWRFEAMGYVKNLFNVKEDDENFAIANTMLLELFELFGAAYIFDLFKTHKAFTSLRYKQVDFFDQIVKRVVNEQTSSTKLKRLLKICAETIVDDDTLNIELFYKLNETMNDGQKRECLDHCLSLIEMLEKRKTNSFSKGKAYEAYRMPINRQINVLLRERMCLESALGLLSEASFDFYLDHTTHAHVNQALFYALNDVRPLSDEEVVRYYRYFMDQLHIPRSTALNQIYARSLIRLKDQENNHDDQGK